MRYASCRDHYGGLTECGGRHIIFLVKAMKIGVVSDTHVSRVDQLPANLLEMLEEVDLVVHLGDYTGIELLDGLRSLGDFRGVFGNMDSSEVRAELPEKEVIELGGKRLGLIHGWGAPSGIHGRIKDRFGSVDAVLYGHTHMAENELVWGTLFFNPGSATGRFPAESKTFGILVIEESIQGEIIAIE
ncbi:MAG TPA: metallophosphoesterase family protein [Dehalococcoidia bacterium]|nr:metallophosphoesterase family protein [Dehalococcoidia bacterium]